MALKIDALVEARKRDCQDKLSLLMGIVLDMADEAVTRDFEVTLEIPAADPADMSGDQRRAALASVRRVEARLAGWKTRLIGAERDQHGVGAAEMVVREELQTSKREAKRGWSAPAATTTSTTTAGRLPGVPPPGDMTCGHPPSRFPNPALPSTDHLSETRFS